ncbi:hypothetical protein ACQR1N_30985 [Bradyrhizobium sp. HKCCYLRH1073]|uniref:hypothetical protein n=1 Tax=unclassified Bradyrhizobium TaxID=2631580 RepID=UPI003EB7B061
MDTNTWNTTLTIETTQNDLTKMRRWLDEHAPPAPSRNADVLAKFMRAMLVTDAGWEGVFCDFALERPKPVITRPWAHDQEWPDEPDPSEPRNRLTLAVGGCAALMVLACIGLIASHAFDIPPASPHIPPSWYNAGHAAQLMLHHLLAMCETC